LCHKQRNTMKSSTITISKEQILKSEKARHRAELIATGQYNMFKNQTFKDKKAYSRKAKHKNEI
jgi:hypothetical protein